ncbi:LOG family protein [Futiania mangrovi]|uniref:Cytokinin riboside 5'-monophosphate phosphoribohydrolase n=1 Tax=Futiania mangrovi TaxID=2959716 RepID=A0A9J6P814_9PROT|nr:TIGR00730 family Rossman fold protein [Futiania mangrovii]MCP1335612.1 TIGR00730 family Rossman fold protein [Futiania mangrovii]
MAPPFASLCVYCGSSPGTHHAYVRLAEATGRLLGANGIRLVYGGGNVGLMGAAARAALDAGGEAVGIIPEFLRAREVALEDLTELHVVDDMHTRKRMMFDMSDGFVVLPGGIGTLDETVEMLTWRQLGRHEKPVFLVDHEGFWRPLIDLFCHMTEAGFLKPDVHEFYELLPDLSALSRRLGLSEE